LKSLQYTLVPAWLLVSEKVKSARRLRAKEDANRQKYRKIRKKYLEIGYQQNTVEFFDVPLQKGQYIATNFTNALSYFKGMVALVRWFVKMALVVSATAQCLEKMSN